MERANAAKQFYEEFERQNQQMEQFLIENRAKEREATNRAREARIARAPEILRQETLEKLPKVEQAIEKIKSGTGENMVVRVTDLSRVAEFLATRREYLPPSKYDAFAREIHDQAANIKNLFSVFERDPGDIRLSPVEIKQTILPILMNLRHIAPEDFPSTLINLSDEEILDMGSQNPLRTLRDARNHVRELFARADLAEFDPERFQRIFGPKYTAKDMEAEDRSWEDWDRMNPIKVPTCTQKWAMIRRVLTHQNYPIAGSRRCPDLFPQPWA